MSLERRIRDAFVEADATEPAVDLWARIEQATEADRQHRRRVRRVVLLAAVAVAVVVAAARFFVLETTLGRLAVDWRWMEVIETVTLIALVLVLGPAVRRFGEGYAGAVFRAHPPTGERFIRLLDVAYYLVFSGYVLFTTTFERPLEATLRLGDQIEAGLGRVAGMLLLMGVMHALTFLALPFVGVIFTATRHGKKLPRWMNIVLVIVAVLGLLFVLNNLVGLIAIGVSG